ncbi:MAG: segregation/condensation protein A [Betaproteobacteria bacterium]|nr:segregation/condensation protein A [Betaproteobacteria bacterium]
MIEALAPAPVARIYGEPLLEVPQDLYIPPDALEVFLEAFEGPLDLLLYLIRKQNLNVLDIPMAKVTAQYMEYVEMMRAHQLELAADYLLMAAVLIEIKSRMLLPRPAAPGEAEVEDPRAELVRRLMEYEKMKLASLRLNELPQALRDFALVEVWIEQTAVMRLPQVDPDDLKLAWLGLVSRAKLSRHHRVTREELSVRAHMTRILKRLSGHEYVEFAELFSPSAGVAELVVTFLALLELARETLVEVTQQETYGAIYVRSTHFLTAA